MRTKQNTKPKQAPAAKAEKSFMDVRLEALQAEMRKADEMIAQHEAILRGLHETRLRIEGAILVLEELQQQQNADSKSAAEAQDASEIDAPQAEACLEE